jgi:hypothetical protein
VNNQLAVANQNQILSTFSDVEKAALAMAKSGYFQDSRDQAQAVVKILAGQELGFGPFASMTGVYIISGRPSIGANLMAAAVKKSGRYNYRVVEMTDKACEIAFFEAGAEIGRSRFTIDDAKKAQTKNLDKFPRNMLFARAISNGVRWYCPDVFSGAPVYTPEEMGAVVDDEGRVLNVPENKNIIEGEISEPEQPPERVEYTREDAEKDAPAVAGKMSLETALNVTNSEGIRYGDIESGKLSHMTAGIGQALRKPNLTEEARAEYEYKLDAIRVILANRTN